MTGAPACSARCVGSSVAPLLGGLIADQWGLSATFYFLAATIVVANLFILAMPRSAADQATQPTAT